MFRWLCRGLLLVCGGVLAAVPTEPEVTPVNLMELDQEFRDFVADLLELQGKSEFNAKDYSQFVLRHKAAINKFLHAEYEVLLKGFQNGQLSEKLQQMRIGMLNTHRVAMPGSLKELAQGAWSNPKSVFHPAWNALMKFKEEFVRFVYRTLMNANKVQLGNIKVFDFDEAVEGFFKNKAATIHKASKTHMDDYLNIFKISETYEFHKIMDPVSGIKTGDAEQDEILRSFMPRYFDRRSPDQKRQLIVNALRLKPEDPESTRIAGFLSVTGPFFRKNLQTLGSFAGGEDLQIALSTLQSQNARDDIETVKRTIEKETGKKVHVIFPNFDDEALGSGTIASTYRAGNKAVKVVKAGIAQEFEDDYQQVRSSVDPEWHHWVDERNKQYKSEMNLMNEARSVAIGTMANHQPELGIHVARLDTSIKATPNMIVLELAPGKSLVSMTDKEQIPTRIRVLEKLTRQFLNSVIYGNRTLTTAEIEQYRRQLEPLFGRDEFEKMVKEVTGFFHGDLIGGNIYVRGESPTMIDHGLTASVTHEQRKALLKFLLATKLNPHFRAEGVRRNPKEIPRKIIQAMERFGGRYIEIKKKMALENELEEALLRHRGTDEERVTQIYRVILKNKVPMPQSFATFEKAISILVAEGEKVNRMAEANGIKQRYDMEKIFTEEIHKNLPAAFDPLRWVGLKRAHTFDAEDMADMLDIDVNKSRTARDMPLPKKVPPPSCSETVRKSLQ